MFSESRTHALDNDLNEYCATDWPLDIFKIDIFVAGWLEYLAVDVVEIFYWVFLTCFWLFHRWHVMRGDFSFWFCAGWLMLVV